MADRTESARGGLIRAFLAADVVRTEDFSWDTPVLAEAERMADAALTVLAAPADDIAAPGAVPDIVGGTKTDPGDVDLDDAIEQIVGDYIPDSLLRIQLAQRVLREVVRRTALDPFARPPGAPAAPRGGRPLACTPCWYGECARCTGRAERVGGPCPCRHGAS